MTGPRSRASVRVLATAAVMTFYAGLVTVAVDEGFESAGRQVLAGSSPSLSGPVGAEEDDSGSLDEAAAVAEGSTGGTTRRGTGGKAGGGAAPEGGLPGTTAPTDASSGGDAQGGGSIVIGIHEDDPGEAFSQFGVTGGPVGNQKVWIDKLIEWINANGGMGGRQVETVHHITESLNGSFEQQAERACTDFTEDHDAVVVMSGARVPTLALADCLARHDTPLVWSYHFMADQATFDRYADYLYMPPMPRAERLGSWMDEMAGVGFFDGGTIGLVRYDTPLHDRLSNEVLKPRLAAHGLSVKEEVAFRPATGAASAADLSAQSNNAVLRFVGAGVNRVIFVPTSAVVPLVFFKAAAAQGFRPRYTYTSYDIPSFQDANLSDNPEQLRGSMGLGWLPAGDVDWEQQPPLTPAAQRCVEITAGADPPGSGFVRRYCEGLFFLKEIFDRGAEPTTAGIRAVVDSLGTSYIPAWTFSTSVGPGRHDGMASARIFAFDDSCECYTYVGPERPVP